MHTHTPPIGIITYWKPFSDQAIDVSNEVKLLKYIIWDDKVPIWDDNVPIWDVNVSNWGTLW
jgi:hypothetical protein